MALALSLIVTLALILALTLAPGLTSVLTLTLALTPALGLALSLTLALVLTLSYSTHIYGLCEKILTFGMFLMLKNNDGSFLPARHKKESTNSHKSHLKTSSP